MILRYLWQTRECKNCTVFRKNAKPATTGMGSSSQKLYWKFPEDNGGRDENENYDLRGSQHRSSCIVTNCSN